MKRHRLQKWISKLGLSLLISATLISVIHAKSTPYFNPETKINYDIPENWVPTKSTRQVMILSSQKEATINIITTFYDTPITINGYQDIRKVSHYDGWQLLIERPGTSYENQKANADESIIGVYQKSHMDENAALKRLLVGEYNFRKGQEITSISLETPQANWKWVQDSFKEVVESFWFGEGNRPASLKPSPISRNWPMTGQNPQYTYSLPIDLPKVASTNFAWEQALPATKHFDTKTSETYGVWVTDEQVRCYEKKTGKPVWEYDIEPGSATSMALSNDTLYLLKNNQHSSLIAIQLSTGRFLFKHPLKSRIQHALVMAHESLYFIQDHALIRFDPETQSETRIPILFQIRNDIPPVFDTYKVIVQSEDDTIIGFDLIQNMPLFETSLGFSLQFPPSVENQLALVTPTEPDGSLFGTIDTASGNMVWEYSDPDFKLVQHPVINQNYVIANLKNSETEERKIVILDQQTGGLVWQLPSISPKTTPILTQSQLLLFDPVATANGLSIFSLQTGQTNTLNLGNTRGNKIQIAEDGFYFYPENPEKTPTTNVIKKILIK